MRRPPIPTRAVWIDGRICRGEEARLSLFDRGARDGEGLFETLRVYGGRPFAWPRHMERLVLSAAVLGFPVPASPVTLRGALGELLAAEGLSDAVARITVTRGIPGGRPTRTGAWVEVEPLAGRLWSGTRSGSASVVVSKRPFEPGPLGAHKTTSRLAYHLAREEARVARVDEALLVRPSGEVLEGTVSNLFALRGGEALTPPLASGILPGVTRALVLGLGDTVRVPMREQPLTLADLESAEELWLTNSVQEIVRVGTVEGRTVRTGPIAVRLGDAYRALVEREIAGAHRL
ncbi:MAG TPA: aminotransferase class IV [Candidatus Eisenbacteria bacterium]|nr:aminotransferase class IV [Candidatus Eisenbacteria bacterium]